MTQQGKGTKEMTQAETLREMRQDIRDIHLKIDRHTEHNNKENVFIRTALAEISASLVHPEKFEDLEEQVKSNKVKVSFMIAICILCVPPFVGWVIAHIGSNPS